MGISANTTGDSVVFLFSNSSLTSHAGIFVGTETNCQNTQGYDSLAVDPLHNFQSLNYTIQGSKIVVHCTSSDGMVQINSDHSQCFLYGPTGLPAPPVQYHCAKRAVGTFVI